MIERYRKWVVAAVLLLTPLAGNAVTCSASAPNINFGSYNTLNTIQLPASDISVTCAGLGFVAPKVTLSSGSGSYSARVMNGPAGNTLQYNLYTNSSYTTVFGDGSSGTGYYTGSLQFLFFGSVTYSVPVYAQLPGEQNVAPGTYSTNTPITVTVSY
ncbi:spore coat protein U domain-containing protein [Acidithiobacillus sp. M4-SHS-6]|uniref:spore coat protein U domain-containing protein n=1 Tax=Acidithiobacillus sp. M4-SHS-6 TaxID=3383024 RepID=UPI0039BE3EBB